MYQDELSLYHTADGSITFFSSNFQEAFHSSHGAKQESEAKFVEPSRILEKAVQQPTVRILDVCYGLGYNSAAVIAALANIPTKLEIIALELNPQVPQAALSENLVEIWPPLVQQILQEVAINQTAKTENCEIQLLIGDARQTLQSLPLQWADAIFLDPFSPPRCPQLWTVEFMNLLAQRLQSGGYLVTYSCAAAVRSAMLEANLVFGSTTPVGRRSPGTIATLTNNSHKSSTISPLSIAETEVLQTRSAIPYRDPNLTDTATEILTRRQQEQSISKLEPTSHWKKRHLL